MTQDQDIKITPPPQPPPKKEPSRIDIKKALDSLPGGGDAEVDVDQLEQELIKQTGLARDLGYDRARLFFRQMISNESSGKDSAVGVNPRGVRARGRWQISDETAKGKYKLDSTNPVANILMGTSEWNEGYEAAGEISQDPRIRAAIATAYYHHGPKTILEMKRNGGQFPTAWDGGTTTNDHVFKVMSGWKKLIDEEGLDLNWAEEEPTSEEPRLLDDVEEVKGENLFSGKLADGKSTYSGPAPDPRAAMQSFTINFSPEEQAQYAKASPESRRDMLKGAYANYLETKGHKRKDVFEAIEYIRSENPQYFDQAMDTSIGSVGGLDVDSTIEGAVQAYSEGGKDKIKSYLDNVRKERQGFFQEELTKQDQLQAELSKIAAQMRDAKVTGDGSYLGMDAKTGLNDPLDKTLVSSTSAAILDAMGGGAGVVGILAGKLGWDGLDRALTDFSEKEYKKSKTIREYQQYIQNRDPYYPDWMYSSARMLGGLPVQITSAAAGGPTGIYLTTLAQSANQPPLEALINSQINAVSGGLVAPVGKLTAAQVAIYASREMGVNALQTIPGLAKASAGKLYAAYNPGKVSKEELARINEDFRQQTSDFIAGTIVAGAGAGLARMGGKKVSVADTDNLAMPKLPRIFEGLDEIFSRPTGQDAVRVRTPEESLRVTNEKLEKTGSVASIAAVTHPEVSGAIRDEDGLVKGKVLTSIIEVPNPDGDGNLSYAQFIDSDGNVLPLELLTEEGAEIYRARLRNIGQAVKEGKSTEDVARVISESQPTEIELGVEKVNRALENEAKNMEDEYQAQLGKFDETKAKFDEQLKATREQLAQFKKFAEEPDFVTEHRINVQNSATGAQMNMGANLISHAIVLGYDTYRLVKDAGKGFAEWLSEMTSKVDSKLHPYLPDIYEKMIFLNETKTLSQVTKDPETGEWRFSGEPVRLYHATRNEFGDYSIAEYGSATDMGWYGIGVYMGDIQEASKYAQGEGAHIRPQWVNIKSPLIWDYAKDSSMQRYLQNWKIENGQVLSPEDRAPGQAWKLPKEIHDEAENFVRDYLESKIAQSQPKKLPLNIEPITNWQGKWAIANKETGQQLSEWHISLGDAEKEVAGLLYNRVTDDDLHQLSRGITTIMKDKGYDGVFVVEESNDAAHGFYTKAITKEQFDKVNSLFQQETGSALFGETPKELPTKSEVFDILVQGYKGLGVDTNTQPQQHILKTVFGGNNKSFRIKEYVAFSPDQILSTFEGWTPRDINTGELLNPNTIDPNAPIRYPKSLRRSEAGYVDIRDLIEVGSIAYLHMRKFGRSLNRTFVSRIKGVAQGGREAKEYQLNLYETQLQEIDKTVADLQSQYPTATPGRKSSITRQLKSLRKEKLDISTKAAIKLHEDLANNATTSWVKYFSAQVHSKAMLLKFAQDAAPILKSLGSSIAEYYLYRVQDRLEGARQRYIDWANSISAMTDDDIIYAFIRPQGIDFYNAVRAMNEVRPGSFEDHKTLLHNLRDAANTGDFTLIRKQLENTFNLAASMIPTDVFPDYHSYRAGNRLDPVNAIYKTTIAEPLRVAYEATDSVPSAYLGNDNLYYPLISETPQGVIVRKGGLFRKPELQKPKSPASKFTTGLSDKYNIDIHNVQQTLSGIIRAGDRAAFIQSLMDMGIARSLGQHKDNLGRWVNDDIPEGWSDPIDAGPFRLSTSKTVVGSIVGEKTYSVPVKQLILPKELYNDVKPFLDSAGIYSEAELNKLVGKLTGIAILGILEPVYHSWNVVDGLRAQLGWLPTDVWSTNSRTGQAIAYLANKILTSFAYSPTSGLTAALSSIPIVGKLAPLTDPRTLYTFGKIMSMNLFSPDQIKRDKMWQLFSYLLERGSVPERIGHTTYSPEIANQMGSHLVGPMQWKPIREMYKRISGKEVPDPAVDPRKFQEGSWWDEKFTGTKWEKPLTTIKGVAQTFSMSPLVFGWNGIDLRARLAVAEALQHYSPDMTPMETFEILSLLGVYNRFAESKLGNILKRTQIAPFYSASSARARRVFQAWNPATPYGAKGRFMGAMDPQEKTIARRLSAAFQESAYTFVGMWAIAHHSYTGKWPWEDEEARLLKIKIPKEDIAKDRILSTLMPATDKEGYVSFAPFFGGSSGATMFGLDGMFKAWVGTQMDESITTIEKLDLGRRIGLGQAATTYAHVVGSGPIVHLGPKILFNVDPAISYVPSARGGGEYKLLQHNIKSYGWKGIGKQALGAVLELNAMVDNMAGFMDVSPNEFETYDNPWTSESVKFVFQLGTHNFIKSQENPLRTSSMFRKSILRGRVERPAKPGAARKFSDSDNEE